MSDADSTRKCYEVLLEEHVRLRAMLAELTEILRERTADVAQLLRRLRELSELIDEHFRNEEDSECFAELVSHAPHVSEKVNVVIAEHGELRAEVAGLIQRLADCDGSTGCWDQFCAAFSRFTETLMRHEETENELVQVVFTEDIGSKD